MLSCSLQKDKAAISPNKRCVASIFFSEWQCHHLLFICSCQQSYRSGCGLSYGLQRERGFTKILNGSDTQDTICRGAGVYECACDIMGFVFWEALCVCACNPRVGLLSAVGWMSCSKGRGLYCPRWLWVTHYISLTTALFSLFLSPSSTPSLEVIYKITWMKISISAIVWSVSNTVCVCVCVERDGEKRVEKEEEEEGAGGREWGRVENKRD